MITAHVIAAPLELIRLLRTSELRRATGFPLHLFHLGAPKVAERLLLAMGDVNESCEIKTPPLLAIAACDLVGIRTRCRALSWMCRLTISLTCQGGEKSTLSVNPGIFDPLVNETQITIQPETINSISMTASETYCTGTRLDKACLTQSIYTNWKSSRSLGQRKSNFWAGITYRQSARR
jgi:hypothetical protein